MSEKTWRNVFLFGSLFFLLILIGMTVDSLRQVASARTPQVTAQVAEGKRIWQGKNCNDCHTILGIGGYYAPELTKVVDRRGAQWLTAWLKDPLVIDPQATMPNQQLSDMQITNLVAFFEWVGKIDTNGWPPQPLAAASAGVGASPGVLLVQQKGCTGCHIIAGQGTSTFGPDLSHIGSQPYDALPNTPDFLTKWLADPPAQKPGTQMPRLPLSQAEIDTIVQYLTGLK